MVIEGIWFHKIDDVETIGLARFGVAYAEVVPLSVAACVIVWLEYQIILELIHLNGSSEVPRFKPRLENQRIVLPLLGCIER